jgi:hypothetical protein
MYVWCMFAALSTICYTPCICSYHLCTMLYIVCCTDSIIQSCEFYLKTALPLSWFTSIHSFVRYNYVIIIHTCVCVLYIHLLSLLFTMTYSWIISGHHMPQFICKLMENYF